jgi:hypothetical protein
MLNLVPLLLAAAPVATTLPGLYRAQQMEVAAGLELKEDGRFRYALEYGAVSETGEGKWTSDGKTVRLTSDPMPKAPSFEIVRDDPAPIGELWATLEDPGFAWGGPLEMLLTIEGEKALVRAEADESGRVHAGGKRILAIHPVVPVYELYGAPLPLSPDRGHKVTVRFVPNDLGKARFVNAPMTIDGDGLVIERYDTPIRFQRVGPPLKQPSGG